MLELGCGAGDLLAAIAPNSDSTFAGGGGQSVGVDLSPAMIARAQAKYPHCKFIAGDAHHLTAALNANGITTPFDIIILSDLVNDVYDLHEILAELPAFCSPDTRVILNFHSQLWEKPFNFLERRRRVTPRLRQNWFTPDDVANLAHLNGFETVRRFDGYLCPFNLPLITPFLNRYLAKLFPFSLFDLMHFMVLRPVPTKRVERTVSIVIPARNEAGNIEAAILRTPNLGAGTELIFVEGNSTDDTWDVIQAMQKKYAERDIKILRQDGKGKGDAVRKGFAAATGEILMILDADLTVPPEVLPQFYEALASGKAEFVNGVRLVYPQEKGAMRLANLCGNKFFSMAFSWLLERPIKDSLCGTKVLTRKNWERLVANRGYFGDFDPFGDFDLLFGAAKLNLQICDLPVRYRERTYGETNINRWRDGMYLLRMVIFAARRLKFV
ncbi:glycosyl transferase [Planctomycetales bacterium]|nr:glycosyl transferase [Planctomycetales bacterium]